MLTSLLLLLLSGCNDAEPTPTPVPTPVGTSLAVIADSSAEGTALPQASAPTATLQPNDRLSHAEELFRYGDYAAARTEIAPLRRELEASDPIFVESQILLAHAYMEEGFYEEALIILQPLLPTNAISTTIESGTVSLTLAADPTRREATSEENARLYDDLKIEMLYAEALQGAGRMLEAISAFEQFVARNPWSMEVVQTKLANLYEGMGRFDEAIVAYNLAAAEASDASTKAFLLETVARLETSAGRHANAVAAYEGILTVAQRPAYRTLILYRAGQSAMAGGNEPQAIDYWLAATEESPESSDAYLALIELVNRNVDFDLYQRGYIDLKSKAWIPAINAYQAYLDSVPATDERTGLAMLGLVQSYLGAANYATALTTVDALLANYPDCTCTGQAWLEKALILAWLGDSVGSHRTSRTFAREFPDDPLAPEALWQSGLLAFREGSEIEAAIDLLALVDSFPESERAPLSLYLLGTGAYREGLWGQSANFFARMQRDYPDSDAAAVAYWLGRAEYAQSNS